MALRGQSPDFQHRSEDAPASLPSETRAKEERPYPSRDAGPHREGGHVGKVSIVQVVAATASGAVWLDPAVAFVARGRSSGVGRASIPAAAIAALSPTCAWGRDRRDLGETVGRGWATQVGTTYWHRHWSASDGGRAHPDAGEEPSGPGRRARIQISNVNWTLPSDPSRRVHSRSTVARYQRLARVGPSEGRIGAVAAPG